ncbi:MAG: winged helix-turn-helix domain-containing protein [Saprospiraceae bacterium]
MFDELDPLLHSQLRLAVMSLLIGVEEAEFNFLKDKTGATAGNLSVQVHKLADANYLSIEKSYRNNFPLTICRITPKGIAAFERYVDTLKQYIDPR